MTSDEARKVAEETAATIVERAWRTVTDRSEANIASILIRELTTALLSAARVPEGCVREGVTDRRVNGKFKYTEDGAIACEEGTCWCVYFHVGNDAWEVSECRRSGNPMDYGCWWQVDNCDSESVEVAGVYSTKELAEAALASRPNPTGTDAGVWDPKIFDAALAARKDGAKDE